MTIAQRRRQLRLLTIAFLMSTQSHHDDKTKLSK